jgi:steroid 5-alpha reductase family enzyme
VANFGWASGLAFLGAFYALKGDGYGPRRLLIGTMVFVWGARLAWHIFSDRLLGGKEEAPRYTAIRELFFFVFQALLALLFSVPFALLAIDPLQRITGYEWLGFFIWIAAFGGESIADAQLKAFKSHPDNAGRVCEDGFWYHSRHPNYFFECLIWVSYFVAPLATDYGAWTLYCPVLMFFLFRVRSIPSTEKHALLSCGDEYAEYQKTTSAFIPWFKKSP